MKNKRRKRFTLIEWVAVIGMLSIWTVAHRSFGPIKPYPAYNS